jgi:hypothetical protein
MLTWPRARPHGTKGSDSLFATFHISPITATTDPNITNNFRHFPLPQEQPPSGVLVIVYLYLLWPACRHMQTRVLPKPTKSLWQETLVERISVFLTDRSSPDLSYSKKRLNYVSFWTYLCLKRVIFMSYFGRCCVPDMAPQPSPIARVFILWINS